MGGGVGLRGGRGAWEGEGRGAEGLIRKRKQRLFEGCYRREHSFTIGFQWYQSSKSRSGRHPAFISNEEMNSIQAYWSPKEERKMKSFLVESA